MIVYSAIMVFLVNKDFNLTKCFSYIENETKSLGLNVSVKEKNKLLDSNAKSTFKGDTENIFYLFMKMVMIMI